MPGPAHSLRIPGATQHLGEVRRFVEQHARAAQLEEETIAHIKMAVDEACANIIEHAYDNARQEIAVLVMVDNERFTVCIRDQGRPFHPELWSEPDLFRIAKSRKGGGLGVQIMRRLMDQVEYTTRGNTNEVRLTKFRNGRSGPDAGKTA